MSSGGLRRAPDTRPQDAERAATAVRDSLAQLIGALDGKGDTDAVANDFAETEPEAFDVCQQSHFPALAGPVAEMRALVPIIAQTPVPALGSDSGELPRFHAELGPFVGISAAVCGVALAGGFGSSQTGVSTTGGLEGAVRMGLGLEGVLNEAGDGLVFAEAGLRQDASTLGAATVPGRGAITARLRVPFWLIPGALVLATPVLAVSSPQTLQRMAVQAANGGLIPWQTGIATPIGRFQFVFGREVGLSFYRSRRDDAMLISTPGVGPINATLVTLRSLQVERPILEYRPFRSIALDQSSSLLIQFYTGFDTPLQSSVVSPEGAPKPELRTIGLGASGWCLNGDTTYNRGCARVEIQASITTLEQERTEPTRRTRRGLLPSPPAVPEIEGPDASDVARGAAATSEE